MDGGHIIETPSLPRTLRVEVKFTTGTVITIPKREREALISHDENIVGAVAVLLWSGRRDLDARWFIIDISSFSHLSSVQAADLPRLAKARAALAGIRQHLDMTWIPFLAAFRDSSLTGHRALQDELKELHDCGTLATRLTSSDILHYEHRRAVSGIVDHHGALVAGHIFRDLLAYALALAGYRTVHTNAVGVPDIELTDL